MEESLVTLTAKALDMEIHPCPASETGREWLEEVLSGHILHMLETDFSGLIQRLYRIDVAEEQVTEALSATSMKDAAHRLAGLVIDRQMEKLRWRSRSSG